MPVGTHQYHQSRPDFVILGMPFPEHDQYMVWASDNLTQAELEIQAEYVSSFSSLRSHRVWDNIELTVGMHSIIRIIGNSYAECLMKLFNTWTPRQERVTPEIGRSPASLPNRRRELE